VIERLAHDLRTAFPDMKGFFRANLMYMREFVEAWPVAENCPTGCWTIAFAAVSAEEDLPLPATPVLA
jgi:hypothetical protein